MTTNTKDISLGFTPQTFPPGVHICQIISDDAERLEALQQFLLSGLLAGERTCCFSENVTAAMLQDFLGQHNICYQEKINSGALTLAETEAVYFHDNRFDPDQMLNRLTRYHAESVAQGFSGARVIGEMTPKVQQVEGGARLMEYEARVSQLVRTCPVTAVCQYDARRFDGAMIMDVLKAHPFMVVRGEVVRNPFALSPEEILRRRA